MRSMLLRALVVAGLMFAAFATKPQEAQAASCLCGTITDSYSCPIDGSPEATHAACRYLFGGSCVYMMYACVPSGMGWDIECRNCAN